MVPPQCVYSTLGLLQHLARIKHANSRKRVLGDLQVMHETRERRPAPGAWKGLDQPVGRAVTVHAHVQVEVVFVHPILEGLPQDLPRLLLEAGPVFCAEIPLEPLPDLGQKAVREAVG
jgi:hypothetical protein